MHYSLRFFISWIVSATAMYIAFYVWHGMVLNDFKQIEFSMPLFYLMTAAAYLIISFLLYRVFEARIMQFFDNVILRGIISAALVGISLFTVMTVLHIQFTKNVTSTYLMVDLCWQVAEQCLGALFLVLCKHFIYDAPAEEVA